jgi:hypothetical protein
MGMKKIIYFVLLTFSLSAYQNDFLLADGVTCPQANEAALKKLAEVFKPKEDLLLILSGASKAKGVDPRKFPVPGADGKIETVDFVETLAELVQKHSNAIAAIEEATRV